MCEGHQTHRLWMRRPGAPLEGRQSSRLEAVVVWTSLGGSLFSEWTHPFTGEPIPRSSSTGPGGSLLGLIKAMTRRGKQNYRKKILWNLRCAMLRRGRLAPDRTLRLGAEGTQPWRSVGRGMGNYADGPSCAQRPAQGHGTWGTSWGPSAKTVENASCTAAAIVVVASRIAVRRRARGWAREYISKVHAKFHHCCSRDCCSCSHALFCA